MFKLNLEKMEKKSDLKGLVKALDNKDPFIRRDAAEALGRVGNFTVVDSLIIALNDKKPMVRSKIAEALGKIGDNRAVEALIAILKDRDSDVRKESVKALGLIRDQKAVSPLIKALKDENATVRIFAISALGIIENEIAVESLIELLKGDDTVARNEAMEALVKIGKPSVVLLLEALKNQKSEVRSRAAEALGKIGDSRAIEHLVPALSDEDEWVRKNAAEALKNIGDFKTIEHLVPLLGDEHPEVKMAAAEALVKKGYSPSDQEERISFLIAKKDWKELVEIGKAAVTSLIHVVENGDIWDQYSAMEALGRIGDSRAVKTLVEALKIHFRLFAAELERAHHAAEALGNIGDPEAIQPLISLLRKVRKYESHSWSSPRASSEAKALILCLKKTLARFGEQAVEPLILSLRKDSLKWEDIVELLGEVGADERALYALESLHEKEREHLAWDPHDERLDIAAKQEARKRISSRLLPAIERVRYHIQEAKRFPKSTSEQKSSLEWSNDQLCEFVISCSDAEAAILKALADDKEVNSRCLEEILRQKHADLQNVLKEVERKSTDLGYEAPFEIKWINLSESQITLGLRREKYRNVIANSLGKRHKKPVEKEDS